MELSSDIYGIDTNILIYAADKSSIFNKKSSKIFVEIAKGNIKGVITPQNIFEYISVVTSKKQIPKPVSVNTALVDIETYIATGLNVIYPQQESWRRAFELIKKAQISKQKVFDVYLAATLIDNGVKFIITANTSDFEFLGKSLQVINPFI